MPIPLFDAHCDALWRAVRCGESLREGGGHVDLVRGASYAPRAQVFAIWEMSGDREEAYGRQLSFFNREMELCPELVVSCRSAGEAHSAFSSGRQAAFLSVEGAEMIGCSLNGLERAWHDGVRFVNPVWNYENRLCGSCAEGENRGLSAEGKAFVRRCGELGMTVDVSHMSDPGFWDVMDIPGVNVIASHSNARALCGHVRNLTDDMFRALTERGGVAGINLYAAFLGDGADVKTVCAHILHFLELGGERSIGIGADFDGCDRLPSGMRGVQDMRTLYGALLAEGVAENTANDIFFGNFMRNLNLIDRKDGVL